MHTFEARRLLLTMPAFKSKALTFKSKMPTFKSKTPALKSKMPTFNVRCRLKSTFAIFKGMLRDYLRRLYE